MILVSAPALKLEAVLAGAVSANQPEAHVDYIDYNAQNEPTTPSPFRVALNSTTDVTILAAPVGNPRREVLRASIYNKDTASVTVIIKTDDGTTERIICKTTLLTLETLNFEKDRGWYVTTANGAVKTGNDGISLTLIDAKGDLIVGTAADTAARLAVGAAGTIIMSQAAATSGLAYVAALNKAIYGLTYANNAGDATNDLDHAAGGCMDATGAYWITVAALTKRSDAAWVVGTNQGGLDDIGSAGNNDFYIWAIARSDTGVTDILYSLSSTAPTMPASYDFKRLIGWFKRVGGTIVVFTTYETEGGGIELLWTTPTLDISLSATLTTARRTDALKVPLNFSTIAHINVQLYDASTQGQAILCCPDHSDVAPSFGTAPLSNNPWTTILSSARSMFIRTSAAGLIAARADLATVDNYYATTLGFRWARRN